MTKVNMGRFGWILAKSNARSDQFEWFGFQKKFAVFLNGPNRTGVERVGLDGLAGCEANKLILNKKN